MADETFESLCASGGQVLGYGEVVRDTDYQILGHSGNTAISPPEERWIGWKTIPVPHPTFIRMVLSCGEVKP